MAPTTRRAEENEQYERSTSAEPITTQELRQCQHLHLEPEESCHLAEFTTNQSSAENQADETGGDEADGHEHAETKNPQQALTGKSPNHKESRSKKSKTRKRKEKNKTTKLTICIWN